MKKNNVKKSLVCIVAFVTLGIASLIGTVLAQANEDNPNMKLTAKISENKNINTFQNNIFKIKLTLDPGEYKITDNIFTKKIDGTKINLKGDSFKIVGSNHGVVKNGEVTINDINYAQRPPDLISVAPKIELELEIEALKTGIYNNEKSIDKMITFKYKNEKGNYTAEKPLICEKDGELDHIAVNVDKIEYVKPKITGGNPPAKDNEEPFYFGDVVELNYNLVPSELYTSVEGNKEDSAASKKTIYLLDEGALNKADENNETVKDSLIKSLEELKLTKPNAEVALISYGSKAQLIKSGDKEFYSIDELIKNINEVEADEKNGNLGDALRQAQYLINKNKETNISVVLISEGDPAYSLKGADKKSIETNSLKSDEVATGFEEGKEYVDEMVQLINKENKESNRNVDWFNINYGLSENQKVSTEAIKELGGTVVEKQNPTIEDINSINKSANADYILRGTITAISNSKLKVSEKSLSQNVAINYNYAKTENGDFVFNEKGQKKLIPTNKEMPFNVAVKLLSESEIDLADHEILTVTFTPNGITDGNVIFNEKEDENQEFISWPIKPEVAFMKISGLHTGKLDKFSMPKDENFEKLRFMEILSGQMLERINSPYYSLSKDNSFRIGSLVTVNKRMKTNLVIENEDNKVEAINWKVYEYNQEKNEFVKLADKKRDEIKILEPDKIYFIATDCTISDSAEVDSSLGIKYELRLTDMAEIESPNGEGISREKELIKFYFPEEKAEEKDAIADKVIGTIENNINIKDKPKHY